MSNANLDKLNALIDTALNLQAKYEAKNISTIAPFIEPAPPPRSEEFQGAILDSVFISAPDVISFQTNTGYVADQKQPSETIWIWFDLPDMIKRGQNDEFAVWQETILTHWIKYDTGTGVSGLNFSIQGEDLTISLEMEKEDLYGRTLTSYAQTTVRVRN